MTTIIPWQKFGYLKYYC